MAVLAGSTALGNRHRHGAAGNLMVSGLVAFVALEIHAAHVHVAVAGRIVEDAVHVAVLDRIAASALEMAVPAGLSAGFADTLGNGFEIQLRIGQPGIGGDLGVDSGGVVAHQTVHLGLVGEIKAGVLPSVARRGNWCSAASWTSGRHRSC